MKQPIKHMLLTATAFAFAVIGVELLLPATPGTAQQNEEQPAAEAQQPAEDQGGYQYIAQPGDSYSLMARKAIQTYGIENQVELSEGQIIMAETNLTNQAGRPTLTNGQTVQLQAAAVEQWVERAGAVNGAPEAAWQQYARYAEFNTNRVGEPAN